jgi:SOS-response transcriptional repressor LexA
MRTDKLSEYVAQYIKTHGYPRNAEDIRTALKITSKAALVDALDRLAAEGWLHREEQRDNETHEHGQRINGDRQERSIYTDSDAQRVAVNTTIQSIEDLIDQCDKETLDTTLDGLVKYIHARQEMIRAQREMLGEGRVSNE